MRVTLKICVLILAGACAWHFGRAPEKTEAPNTPCEATNTLSVAVTPLPIIDVLNSVLGGFRGVLAEVVWFRAERLQDEGRYGELVQLAAYLALLEPHTPEVWTYAAWNLAYNVSVMMPTLEDRWRWVAIAIRLLRDDALRLNPQDATLHRELAWMFLAKLGGALDEAAPLYRQAWRAEVQRAQKTSENWTQLGLLKAVRDEIDKEYGKQDWTDPLACALYWAHTGLPYAKTTETRAGLRQIIYQTLMAETVREARFAPRCMQELDRACTETPTPYLKHLRARFRARFIKGIGPTR